MFGHSAPVTEKAKHQLFKERITKLSRCFGVLQNLLYDVISFYMTNQMHCG